MAEITRREFIGASGVLAASIFFPVGPFVMASPSIDLPSLLEGKSLTIIAVANAPLMKETVRQYLKQNEVVVFDYNTLTENLDGAQYLSTEDRWQRCSKFNQVLERIARRTSAPTVVVLEVKPQLEFLKLSDLRQFGNLDSSGDMIIFLDRDRAGLRDPKNASIHGTIAKRRGHAYSFRKFEIEWDRRSISSIGNLSIIG